MDLYPAVDIRGGQAVRLYQGDYEQETVYEKDPVEAAKRWVEQGAKHLHVVDLDGARGGKPCSLEDVGRIVRAVDVPVQLGGGLRTVDDVTRALSIGVTRTVIGTAGLSDPDFLRAVTEQYPNQIIMSIDVREGLLAMAGWVETSTVTAVEAIERLQQQGVKRFVYTNIARDGTLAGPDLDDIEQIGGTVNESFLCAGGVGSIEHIEALVALREPKLAGVIVGKALYEGKFTVAEAQVVLDQRS